jgi:ABC-type nitrate/sulfonate/bicarbonate transport system permease component
VTTRERRAAAEEREERASRPRPDARRVLQRLPLLILPVLGLVIWQLVATFLETREWLLPAPASVVETMWTERADLWFHGRATIAAALIGLALAVVGGLALAAIVAASRAAELTVYPWVIATQAVPLLALAPIVAIWTDFGVAQVLVAFLITFFPIVVTGVDGLRSADPELVRTARSMGASRGWLWRHVTFPSALPSLLSGLKLASVFAVTGAVVAEYVGADRGLGYLAEISTAQFDTVLAFAAIAWLALIGVGFFAAATLAERLALPHRHHAVRPAWRRS